MKSSNNNIAPITEEQEGQNTVQELPKQKEKKGILQKVTKWITAFSLATSIILTPQSKAKSDNNTKDNLQMKPLKGTTLAVDENQQQAPYLEDLYLKAKGISQEDQTFSGPGLLVASNDAVMSDNNNSMLLASVEQTPSIEAIEKETDPIHKANLEVLEKAPLPDSIKKSLIAVSEENRKDRQAGDKLMADYPVKIEVVPGIKTEEDIRYIVNDGAELKPQTFEKVAGMGINDFIRRNEKGNIIGDDKFFKDWETIISKLFDTSDVKDWLRTGTERKEMTQKELKSYKDDMATVGEKWKGKIPFWYNYFNSRDAEDKQEGRKSFEKFFEHGLLLFEYAVKNTNFQSREILRRQFVNSFSIAYYKALKEVYKEGATFLLDDVINQVGEFMLLTNKDVYAVKTQIGELKYYSMDDNFLNNVEELKPLIGIFNEFGNESKSEYVYIKDIKIGEQLDKDNAELKKMNELGSEVKNFVKKYNKTLNKDYLAKANKNIAELKEIKKYVEDMEKRKEDQRIKKMTQEAIKDLDKIIGDFEKNYGNLVASN